MTLPIATSLLLGELCLLSLLSRKLTQGLYVLFFRISGSKTIAMTTLIILLFPGTVVHELAHLFVAEVLRVPTGKLTLVPESLDGEDIKAGGVAIAKTDPLRRTLIGLAPVYVGVIVLAVISYFIRHSLAASQESVLQNAFLFYLLFSISNSMFSSKEDMKGVIPFTITVCIFAAAAYIAGFRVGLTGELLAKTLSVAETLVRSLGIVLGVNLVVLAATSFLLATLSPRVPS